MVWPEVDARNSDLITAMMFYVGMDAGRDVLVTTWMGRNEVSTGHIIRVTTCMTRSEMDTRDRDPCPSRACLPVIIVEFAQMAHTANGRGHPRGP